MAITSAAVMAMFILLGIVFITGHGAGLIAGYNTSDPLEKAKYDEKKLCRFMGKGMFALAACYIPVIIGTALRLKCLLIMGFCLFGAVVVFIIVWANTGNRFRRD